MFRPLLMSAGAVLALVLPGFAQTESQVTGPVVPDISSRVPATLPADGVAERGRADVSPAPATILVLPFTPISAKDYEWISKGIQQDLATDLMRQDHSRVIAPGSAVAAQDPQTALQAGREAQVNFVVYGHFQVSDNNLRITGQTLDTTSGQPVGALKATGALRDLFRMEDSLADQVRSSLPTAVAAGPSGSDDGVNYVYRPRDRYSSAPDQGNQSTYAPAATYAPETAYPYDSGSYYSYPQSYYYSPGYSDYPYYDSYPYGYYGYPYYGYPFGFGFFYGGYYHHHGWDDHGRYYGGGGRYYNGHAAYGGAGRVYAPRGGGFGGRVAGGIRSGGISGGGFHGGGGGHR